MGSNQLQKTMRIVESVEQLLSQDILLSYLLLSKKLESLIL